MRRRESGAGKGTQAVGIAAPLQVPAISTGDMFRALQQASTPLATKVRGIMAAGGYLDDATTNAIVDDRLEAATGPTGSCSTATPAHSPRCIT